MDDRWQAIPIFIYGLWLALRPEQQWWLTYGWAVEGGRPTSFSIRLIRWSGILVIFLAGGVAIFGVDDHRIIHR